MTPDPATILSLTGTPQYIKIPYLIIVFGIVLTGVLLLALQNYEAVFWLKHKHQISIVLSTVATIEFMITLQPYSDVEADVSVIRAKFNEWRKRL